ncbi:hypothetical protein ACQP2X_15835 [Actinoplanes sp. CA-131856]
MESSSGEPPLVALVSEGRAVAPVSTGPVPLPPKLADGDVDAAAVLESMREEERC